MLKPKFHGEIAYTDYSGRGWGFKVDDFQAEQMQAYIDGLAGQKVEMVIQKPQDSKTLAQLAYFHGVVCVIASEASGYTREEVKGLLKGEFLTKYVKSPTGKEIAWVPSLADLKKGVMSKFIDDSIILVAKHWHCVVPPPDEVSYQEQ